MLTVFMLAIIGITVAMLWNEGIWSNTLSLINITIAAIVASSYFEPVADFLTGQAPSYTYFWDFLSLWGIFAFVFGLLRAVTDQISKTRVRFKLPVEQIGRFVVAVLAGWMIAMFFLFTLHTAPLARTNFGGAFQPTPNSSNFLLSPDRLWLGFLQSRSENVLATSPPKVFDPQSEFILKYGERRDRFSEMPTMRISETRRIQYQ